MFRRSLVACLLASVGVLAPGADLQTGMKAPGFVATDQNGNQIKLADYLGKSNVVPGSVRPAQGDSTHSL